MQFFSANLLTFLVLNLFFQIHVSGVGTNRMTWDTCSQGSENTIGSFRCTCLDGFILGTDNRTCVPVEPNVQIVFALKNSIRVWSSKDKRQKTIYEGGHTVGVAVDVKNQYVFWTEVTEGNETIYRSKLNGDDRVTLVDTGLNLPEGIAFDWITGNIYFTDSNKSHIVACNGDGKFCSVLIEGYLDKPRQIVLHPSQGLMFWTDWGKDAAIVRAGMDGSIPLQIITKDLVWPNGLAVDHGKSRLYWMDAGLNIIETSTFNGEDRHEIRSEGIDHPFSLDVFADTLYWTDWHFSSIQSCNKLTGENYTELFRETGSGIPHGLAIYHPAAQPKARQNPCATRCSHICVLTPENTFACICPAGFLLDKNNRTCIDDLTKPKLIIGQHSRLRTLRFNSIGRNVVEEKLVSELREIGALIYNPISDTIMISDITLRKIYEYNQRTKKLRVVVAGYVGTVRGMAFDVVGQNLYWIDTSRRRVEVLSTRTGARAEISRESEYPHDILVVAEEKYLFIALSYSKGGRILRMHLNGYKRATLFQITGGEPISMTYNAELQRIFWCDIIKNTIEYVSIDGRSQSVALRGEGNPYSIVSHGNRVYWTDRHTQLLNSMPVFGVFEKKQPMFIGHSEHSENKTLDSHIFGDFLAKITVMDKDISRYSTLIQEHDCGNAQNQKCSHICLISEFENVGTCICPEGMHIGRNGKTCVMNSTCNTHEFQCNDKKCIHEEEVCDGFRDCESAEDEANCKTLAPPVAPIVCREPDYACPDVGKCIEEKEICDGFQDCPGGEDEIDCPWSIPPLCRPPDFLCKSDSECISGPKRCDGGIDCKDGSDEDNCVTPDSTPNDKNLTTFDKDVEENVVDRGHENNFCGASMVINIILVLFLSTLAILLILGFILQRRKKIQPKQFVRPIDPQIVTYENQPNRQLQLDEPGREILLKEREYDDAYDSGTTRNFGQEICANPIYEEIDCHSVLKMV